MAAIFREGRLRWASGQAASDRHSLRFGQADIRSRHRCRAFALDQGPELRGALNGEKSGASAHHDQAQDLRTACISRMHCFSFLSISSRSCFEEQ
jgi:hypothetical protein